MSGERSIFKSLTNCCLHRSYKKSHYSLYTTATTKKSCCSKMPYVISSQSVTGGTSLSVSKLKLVCSSLILVDNKLTLICLLTYQRLITASVCNTQVIQLIWRDQHLWGQKRKANGAHEVINHFACNFAKYSLFTNFKNSTTSRPNDKCVVK